MSSINNGLINLKKQNFESLLKNFNNEKRISGTNHSLYRYPACFSPVVVNTLIELFSKKNSLILDPFCGGGTTGICALMNQRKVILNDLNEFATFITKVKTTKYTLTSINEFEKWFVNIYPKKLQFKKKPFKNFDPRFNRKENWHIRNFIFDYVNKLKFLKNKKSKELANILLLRVIKRAINTSARVPKIAHVKNITIKYFRELLKDVRDFRSYCIKNKVKINKITNYDVRDLQNKYSFKKLKNLDAVITSPPYPGVHIRYDRMQLNGTKVTDIHYLISQTSNKKGVNSYTFSDRTSLLDKKYFNMIRESFESIYEIASKDTYVIQLIGFKKKELLNKYLLTMELAGFKEISISVNNKKINRLWRKVKNRSFHAELKGDLDASNEVLLIHKKAI